MQKIMFNETYGLQRAAIDGTKPMTRRLVRENVLKDAEAYVQKIHGTGHDFLDYLLEKAPYKVGEVVAIAQSYEDAGYTKEWVVQHVKPNPNAKPTDPFENKYPGWTNKMFVKAEFMPNFIKFTDLKIERLQDISDEDCMKEGIIKKPDPFIGKDEMVYYFEGSDIIYAHPATAFAALIDKVSGRGTWERNPFCLCYEFKLVK